MPKSLKDKPFPISQAKKVAKEFLTEYKHLIRRAAVVGSIHRKHPKVYDIDLLVIPRGSQTELASIKMYQDIPMNIFFTSDNSWGASTLHWRLGRSIIQLKRYALSNGFTLNRYGLYDKRTGKKVAGRTEKGIFEALGLKYPGRVWKGPGTMKLLPLDD